MEVAEKIKTQPIPKLIWALSAPAVLSLLLNALNTAIDGIFVAKSAGITALSAVTVSFGVILIIQALSLLIAAGASASISLKMGKSDKQGAEKIIGSACMLSILFSAAITIIGLLTIKPLLSLYGANADNMVYAKEYITVILSGSFFFVTAQSMNNCVKGMGYAKRAFLNSLSSVVTNTILDAVFIFVFKWGVFGAALSTVIGNCVCMLLAMQFLCSKKSAGNLKPSNINLSASKKIMSTGAPASIPQFALSLVSLTFNHVAAFYGGNVGVAAYGIMYNTTMLVYMPIIGLGQGIQPIFGFNYSAGNYTRVRSTLKYSVTCATIFAAGMFLVIELFSSQIISTFGGAGNKALMDMAVPGIRIFTLLLPAVGFQMISANYFQYIGKVKQSVVLSALRQLLLLIPFAILLPTVFEVTGIWIATPTADFISLIVTAIFVRQEVCVIHSQELGVNLVN